MKTDLHKFVVIDGMIISAIRKSDTKELTFRDIYYSVSLIDNQYTESTIREAVKRLIESNHIACVRSVYGNNHTYTIKTTINKKYDFKGCFCQDYKVKRDYRFSFKRLFRMFR